MILSFSDEFQLIDNKSLVVSQSGINVFNVSEDKSRSILGIAIPTVSKSEFCDYFLAGLDNMLELKDVSTILINFQGEWSEDNNDINEVINIINEKGFNCRYIISDYKLIEVENSNLDVRPVAPLNIIREHTSQMLPEASFYLSMDEDMMMAHASPVIGKSGGRQFLEVLHYMSKYDKCGFVSTTGTIGKIPPREYLGPNYDNAFSRHIMTGYGLMLRNLDNYVETYVPKETFSFYGALEDAVAALFRLSEGYYHAKYNCIRVKRKPIKTILSKEGDGWTDDTLLNDNNVGYIKEELSPDFNHRTFSNQVDLDTYLGNGGLVTWEGPIYDNQELTSHYPREFDEGALDQDTLIKEIIKGVESR